MAEQRKYIIDHFSLSIDYLETATSIGITEASIIQSVLNGIEKDLSLAPNTLRVFYDEGMVGDRTYWYTEKTNIDYVADFQSKMYIPKVNPILQ